MIVAQIFLFVPKNCQGAGLLNSAKFTCVGGTPDNPADDCELNDFVEVGIIFAQFLLGLTGSLALVAFIYGGVVLLVSGGSSEKVAQAKSIFIGAVIGLVVVFASWTIIGFIFKSLGIQGNWFNSNWFK